jgi:hypothetical protein
MLKVRLSLLVLICCMACNRADRNITLMKSGGQGDASVEYSESKLHGNYVNATKTVKGVPTNYSLKVSDNGDMLHVLKYFNKDDQKKQDDLNVYRDMLLLVTDTVDAYGPTFFGHPINGYYNDTFLTNNVIRNKSTIKVVTPMEQQELELFTLIDSLARSNKIRYNNFDTSKVLGWFRYKF